MNLSASGTAGGTGNAENSSSVQMVSDAMKTISPRTAAVKNLLDSDLPISPHVLAIRMPIVPKHVTLMMR